MDSISGRCQELASPNLTNFAVSCFLMVGILVSYLPQHYKIISRRSSEGISPYFLLLGTTSGTCAIANILTLPTSREDMSCCRVISPFACAAGLLGIVQVAIIWSCFFLILLLFLIFVPRSDDQQSSHVNKQWRTAVTVVCAAIGHFTITFIISVIMLARFPTHLQTWANILGVACAILASLQYFPQIWTTFKLRHVGSLSVPMMMIQVPGSFIMATSLAVRLGLNGWSTWAVYVVSGTLQGCLLTEALWFQSHERDEAQSRKSSLVGDQGSLNGDLGPEDTVSGHVEDQPDEESPLLGRFPAKSTPPQASYKTSIWVGDGSVHRKPLGKHTVATATGLNNDMAGRNGDPSDEG